jgi:hypothetical protein
MPAFAAGPSELTLITRAPKYSLLTSGLFKFSLFYY